MKYIENINKYEEILKGLYNLIEASDKKAKSLTLLEDKVNQYKVTKTLQKAKDNLRLMYFEVENLINEEEGN